MNNNQYIATLSNHRVLGTIILPYEVERQKDNLFLTVKERLTKSNLKSLNGDMPNGMAELINIVEQYDENEISRVFSKKKKLSNTAYINSLVPEVFEEQIRPYIESRMSKCLNLIVKNNIPLYFKDRTNNIHEEDLIEIASGNSEAVFHFIKDENGIKYYLSIKHNDNNLELVDKPGKILVNSPCRLVLENKLFSFDDIDGKKLLPFFTKKYIEIPLATVDKYMQIYVRNSIKNYSVETEGFKLEHIKQPPKQMLFFEMDLEGKPALLLKFLYDFDTVHLANKPSSDKVLYKKDKGAYSFYKISRDEQFEDEQISFFKKIGLFNNGTPWFYVNTEKPDFYETLNWLVENKEKIESKQISIDQSFFQDKYSFDEVSVDMKVKKENDWFDLYAVVNIGAFQLPFIKFKRNILKNIREYELPDGKIAILPKEWFEKFRDLFLFADKSGDSMRLKAFHSRVVDDFIAMPDKKFLDNVENLQFDPNKQVVPESINATLRPYQTEGFQYMLQSGNGKLGVCLADDMGLGKTLQTITVLQYRFEKKENIIEKVQSSEIQQLTLFRNNDVTTVKERQASLIVMPASLIHNWCNEIQKFAPSIKICIYTGVNRDKDIRNFGEYDVLLTTYGTLRIDVDILKKYQFFYLILDESQVIKNIQSKTYKAVNELDSRYKLVLTGTPIENSLSDLWAQLNFLNKGVLGNYNFFKEEFLQPIEKHCDEQKQLKLQKIIQPFILRRTKNEVAKDLPDLNEQVIYCDLTEEQNEYYEKEKSKVRNSIIENLEQNGVEKSAFIVLQGLTRLRQLANHPALIDKGYKHSSGKYEEVIRNIDNLAIENHKALIFSSFVKNLDVFESYLKEKGYGYSKLTGETKNREQVVNDFQENPDNQFFLISLKAGGVGLNLTAAEYVFLLDPWWNPAAENQAINRAHRIGQQNKVFVYRFISSSTIEEKIMQLQQKKSQLAEVFVNSNNPFKKLTYNNIMELFQ